mgnify:CR=1 FL=1
MTSLETAKMAVKALDSKKALDIKVIKSGYPKGAERQLVNAKEWRDRVNTYFYRKCGIADEKNRKIYD